MYVWYVLNITLKQITKQPPEDYVQGVQGWS